MIAYIKIIIANEYLKKKTHPPSSLNSAAASSPPTVLKSSQTEIFTGSTELTLTLS